MSDWPQYLAFRAASGIAGTLPVPLVTRVGEFGGRLAYRLSPSRRRMATRHMSRVLGTGEDVDRAAQEMFAAYGRYWAEVFWFRPRRTLEVAQNIYVEGLQTVLDIQARGLGMIFALPHVGNWELAGAEARQHGIEVVAVAEALSNRRIAEWFVNVRRELGIEVLLTDSRSRLTRNLLTALRRGAAVALVTDRDLAGRGVPVTFFGEKTTLPAGPAALALRAEVPLLPVACYFTNGVGHRIVVADALEVPGGENEEQRVAAMTQALARHFELLIGRAPHQWHLMQPNWPSDRELE